MQALVSRIKSSEEGSFAALPFFLTLAAMSLGVIWLLVNGLAKPNDYKADTQNAVVSTAATVEEMLDTQLSGTEKSKVQIDVSVVTSGDKIIVNVGGEEREIPLPSEKITVKTSGDSNNAISYLLTGNYHKAFPSFEITYSSLSGSFLEQG